MFLVELSSVYCLIDRSVGGPHGSYGVSYDAVSDRWLITTASLSPNCSPSFHFLSQLLDQLDVGLKMAADDVRSLASHFPLHGLYCTLCYTDVV